MDDSQGRGDGLVDEGGGGWKEYHTAKVTLPSQSTAEEATSSSMPREKKTSFMYL